MSLLIKTILLFLMLPQAMVLEGWESAETKGTLSFTRLTNGLNEPTFEKGQTEFVMVDINNNGHVDIVSIGDHGNPLTNSTQQGIMVWFNDGEGNFTLHMDGLFGYGGIAAGDVNNNGFVDLAFGMHHNSGGSGTLGSKVIEVALGDGTGMNWSPYSEGLAGEGQNWGMFGTDLGDINNNGLLDLVSVSFGCCDGLHVYLNQGDGSWESSFNIMGGNSELQVMFADFNNNGYLDFVTNHAHGTAYFGDGQGNFVINDAGLPNIGNDWGFFGLSVGDINNDGSHGISMSKPGGGIGLYEFDNDANSWIDVTGNLVASDSFYATQLFDMNANGFTDLVAFGDGVIKVWLGDGNSNWTSDAVFAVDQGPGLPSAFTAGGDLTQNGHADIVLLSWEGPQFWNRINLLYVFAENTVPEELCIKNLYPKGNETFYPGAVRFIKWASAVPGNAASQVKIEISPAGADGPYTLIADGLPNNGRYQWTVPDYDSENCHLRITVITDEEEYVHISENPFRILGTTQYFDITAEPNNPDYGTIYGSGEYENYVTVVLTGDPNPGYRFDYWTENDVVVHTGTVYEFIATNDRELTGHFVPDTYIITAIANENGSIIPEGEIIVTGGDSQEFFVLSGEGYRIAEILVNNEAIDLDNTPQWNPESGIYTFQDVTNDHSIEAFFAPDETFISEPGGAALNVYPNPATGHFWVEFINEKGEEVVILVSDPMGQPIKRKHVSGMGKLRIPFENDILRPGLYFVTVKGGGAFPVKKIMISH